MRTPWWRRLFAQNKQTRNDISEPSRVATPELLLQKSMRGFLQTPESADPIHAYTYLLSLPPSSLFDIDERMRGYSSRVFLEWPTTALAQMTAENLEPALRQSLLFLSAGHHDGRIRQKTLWRLSEFPGYLTLASALIRCADWVPEVRHAAHHATRRLLELCDDRDVVALWPLILRLGFRERGSSEWFKDNIESWALHAESQPLLRALLASRDAKVRAWNFSNSLEAGVDVGADLLQLAIHDPNPAIGLHALRHAKCRGDCIRTRSLAKAGLDAPHPVIRRESLRALSELDGALTRDRLLITICDTSAGVRSLSAFLLQERYSETSLAHWRAVLDGNGERPSLGALVSLADHAQPEDAERMRQRLSDPSSLARMHALRGLIKAGGQLNDDEFAGLVAKGGNRLLRLLSDLIRAGDIKLGVERINLTLMSSTESAYTSATLRYLLRNLGHWQRLELLLQTPATLDPIREWWRQAVLDWIADSGIYAPMGPNRRLGLLQLAEERHDEIDIDQYNTIKSAILRH